MATFIGTDILTEAMVSLPPQDPGTIADEFVTEPQSLTQDATQLTTCNHCMGTTDGFVSRTSENFIMELTSGVTFLPFVTEPSPIATNTSRQLDALNLTSLPEVVSDREELVRRFLVGVLSVFLAVAVTFGNTLVILAVYRERHLRTVTNFFIVSLACADFLIGTVVLPFSIHMEITQGYWPYGVVWCDLWHAFDVLGCTASILNLCVIACDRYWAITHPISYPTRMTKRTAGILIGVAWTCSALISFPCIWLWHAVEPPHPPYQCIFPSNSVYLITSSCVSFYVPSIIMVFLYIKIYRTAVGQVRAIRSGTKRVKSVNGNGMAMRVHKGGGVRTIDGSLQKRTSTTYNSNSSHSVQGAVNRRNSVPGKRLMSRLSREHKAARTLGIVMGVFIICWLPFFIFNVTAPVCTSCSFHPIIIGTVTWLGYVNSALNPIIYAFASRRFKHAFTRILCAWRRKKRKPVGSDRARNGSVVLNGHPVVGDTSITQYSEEHGSIDTSSSANSNLRYTLPYIYF